MRLISSQRYLNEAIVAEKMALPPEALGIRHVDFEVAGVAYRAVVNGHHRLAAAMRRGIDPVLLGFDQRWKDAFAAWVLSQKADSDWYDITTGEDIPELRDALSTWTSSLPCPDELEEPHVLHQTLDRRAVDARA